MGNSDVAFSCFLQLFVSACGHGKVKPNNCKTHRTNYLLCQAHCRT